MKRKSNQIALSLFLSLFCGISNSMSQKDETTEKPLSAEYIDYNFMLSEKEKQVYDATLECMEANNDKSLKIGLKKLQNLISEGEFMPIYRSIMKIKETIKYIRPLIARYAFSENPKETMLNEFESLRLSLYQTIFTIKTLASSIALGYFIKMNIEGELLPFYSDTRETMITINNIALFSDNEKTALKTLLKKIARPLNNPVNIAKKEIKATFSSILNAHNNDRSIAQTLWIIYNEIINLFSDNQFSPEDIAIINYDVLPMLNRIINPDQSEYNNDESEVD